MACHSFIHLPDVTRGTWKNFDDVTASFVSCSKFPSDQEGKLVSLLLKDASLFYTINEVSWNPSMVVKFATKVRSLEAIPPAAHDALL